VKTCCSVSRKDSGSGYTVLHRTNIVVWPLGTAPGTLRWCRCEFLMLLCDWDYSAVQQGIEGTNDFTQLISSFICWRLEILALELWRVSKNKENQTQSLPGIRDQLLEANHWPSTDLSESLWLTLSHLLSQRTPIIIPFHQCRSRQESLDPKGAYRLPLPSIPWLAEESAETISSTGNFSYYYFIIRHPENLHISFCLPYISLFLRSNSIHSERLFVWASAFGSWER
jgi:hypothetical protein